MTNYTLTLDSLFLFGCSNPSLSLREREILFDLRLRKKLGEGIL